MSALARWWFPAVPLARIAWLRAAIYLFVPLDLLVVTPWVRHHDAVPGELYQPLFVGRLLPFPTPTAGLINALEIALLVAAPLAATGRAPRLLGWLVFGLYFEWMLVAMSYGKVDHDHAALLVALAVLPTVGRAGFREQRHSDAAGWALRCIEVAVVATYFLASIAKLRFGGPDWVNSATLTRALLRRGTDLAQPLLENPWILHVGQWGIMTFELLSPVIFFLSARWRYAAVAFLASFHLVTYSLITIHFLPHTVCLLALLPLERLGRSRLGWGVLSPGPEPGPEPGRGRGRRRLSASPAASDGAPATGAAPARA